MGGARNVAVASALLAALVVAPSASAKVLHDQLQPQGANYILSDNFGFSENEFDSRAADDFVVPPGQIWRLTRVHVVGESGPGLSPVVDVFIYRTSGARPGTPRSGGANNVTASGSPNYSIPMSSVALQGGTYWISVEQQEATYTTGIDWEWATSLAGSGNPAVFRNPGGGFGDGCTNWTPITTCYAISESDLAFSLEGTASSGSFALKRPSRNKRRGIAFMSVDPPGPGVLTLAGRGIRRQELTVDGAKLILRIASSRRARRILAARGVFETQARVTYQAGDATPYVATMPVELKRRKR